MNAGVEGVGLGIEGEWAHWADRHTFLVIFAGLPPLGPPARLDFYNFCLKMYT